MVEPIEEMGESRAGVGWEKLESCLGFVRFEMPTRTISLIGQELRNLTSSLTVYGL